MKTQKLFTLIVAIATSMILNAQKTALHSNGTVSFFNGPIALINAYNQSVNGDTIYLSGGSFNSPSELTNRLEL
ncbi:MAG: hypothetical protein ACOX4D_07550 [Bacteroidales bacterium]|jgi:hypothetical protein